MNQLSAFSPHGRSGSLGTMYNREISLSAEKLVFHHVQQKPIFPCHKMRTDVEARVNSWSSRGRRKASIQSEQDRWGNLIFLLLLPIPAANPHLQLVMTCSNPLQKSYQRIAASYGKYQGKKTSDRKSFFLTKALNMKEGTGFIGCTGRFL